MTVVYNITNEPWLKYNMAAIADRGLKPSQWTSARFQTQVLLVETARYTCSSSCAHGNCQVHLLFFLCSGQLPVARALLLSSWRLPGISALLLVILETVRYTCSPFCVVQDCQVYLLFFLCFWRLPGISALLLVWFKSARYIYSSSCAHGNCQVHLLFFLCSWRLPGTSALLLVLLATARWIFSVSCVHRDCQVHLLFFFFHPCIWLRPFFFF